MFLIPLLLIFFGLAGIFFPEYVIKEPKSYSPFIFLCITLAGVYVSYKRHKGFYKNKK